MPALSEGVSEFLVGEIKHYVDPDVKIHERSSEIVGTNLPLLDRDTHYRDVHASD